jgi:hypothetical protein
LKCGRLDLGKLNKKKKRNLLKLICKLKVWEASWNSTEVMKRGIEESEGAKGAQDESGVRASNTRSVFICALFGGVAGTRGARRAGGGRRRRQEKALAAGEGVESKEPNRSARR